MPPKSKKLPVKVATSTTPKKKKPLGVNSMDLLAEGIHGLYVGCKLCSFKVNYPFFLWGLFTKTKGPYVTNFCEVDIYVGMPTPQENFLFALSPDDNHFIYKKAVPEMFGEADHLRLEMKKKYCLDNS